MRKSLCPIGASSLVLSACAQTPDVQIGYYIPKSSAAIKAIRTVGCDKAGQLYSTTNVTSKASFSAGEAAPPIRFHALGGALSNTDLTVNLTDDGRLKGINASTEGQGEEIIKSLAAVVPAFIPFAEVIKIPGLIAPAGPNPACALIKQYGKKGVLTLTYTAKEDFAEPFHAPKEMELPRDSLPYERQINAALDVLCLGVGPKELDKIPVASSTQDPNNLPDGAQMAWRDAAMTVYLRQPASVPLWVTAVPRSETCAKAKMKPAENSSQTPIWAGGADVPQLGKRYTLPIPRGAAFGSQGFALALSEAGTITQLQYSKKGGAVGVLNSLAALKPSSAEDKANELKGEADLIAQQQRLIKCQTEASCS